MNIILIYFALKYQGDWNKIFKALESKEKVSLQQLNDLENKIKKEKWDIITILDVNYPIQLKNAYKPPFVLWLKGNKKILKDDFLMATGDHWKDSISNNIEKSLKEIEKSNTLISLGFKGIDEFILNNSSKPVLHILASGINQYLVKVKKDDLLISEYPIDGVQTKEKLRNRNRLIAAFASALILYSSKKDGGINNLINNFLSLGKEIYCFPGDGSENDGNSELIKQGANLITEIKDIHIN